VPRTLSGEIRIVSYGELGGLGESQNEPVTYTIGSRDKIWILYVLIPWFLFTAFFVRGFLRERKSWMILIVLAISEVFLIILKTILRKVSLGSLYGLHEYVYDYYHPVILSVCMILLIADTFRNKKGIMILLRSLLIFSSMGIMVLLSTEPEDFREIISFAVYYGIFAMGLVLGMILVSLINRRRFRPILFKGILFVTLIFFVIVFLFIFMIILYWNSGYYISFRLLPETISQGFILGLILYLCLMPCLILCLKSGNYRERLAWILKIPGIYPPAPASEEKQIPE